MKKLRAVYWALSLLIRGATLRRAACRGACIVLDEPAQASPRAANPPAHVRLSGKSLSSDS